MSELAKERFIAKLSPSSALLSLYPMDPTRLTRNRIQSMAQYNSGMMSQLCPSLLIIYCHFANPPMTGLLRFFEDMIAEGCILYVLLQIEANWSDLYA